ncbi:MAG: hypothetical protein JXQ23_09230 [Clostridia bacterium]|nr:hypothetical protein [Clostridia bacterium]
MKSHYKKLLEYSDLGIPKSLKSQCLDKNSREYGGYFEQRKGFSEPSGPISTAASYMILYYNSESAYYKNELLLDRAILAAQYSLNAMHEDGTIDLIETNFHDATSFGFTVWGVAPAYRVMLKYTDNSEKEKKILAIFREFLERGADGMKHGGFHTPNHRWVMGSAMAILSNILDRPDLVEALDLYTNEGIDCNEDGEFSERSAGIYNVVNNRGLLFMAEELGRWEYLDHVTRNLYMMFTYMEPDDTLLTINSRRQDFGKEIYPLVYYDNYLLAAHYTKNKHFAYMADYLFKMTNDYVKDKSSLNLLSFPKFLANYMLHDFLREEELEKEPFDWEHYEHFYQESNIVRYRNNDLTVTVVAENDVFLKMQYGTNQVSLRFAASFFGDNGQFIPKKVEKTADGYRLHYHCDWGYVRPLGRPDHPIKDGRTNKAHREPVLMQIYDVTADIRLLENGVNVKMTSDSCENLPFKIEFIYLPDGFFTCDQVQCKAAAGQHLLVKNGFYTYHKDGYTIKADNAVGETTYHSDLRGSNPPISNAFTVFYTGFSPATREFNLTAE